MTKTNLLNQMTTESPSEPTSISQRSPLNHLELNLFADLKQQLQYQLVQILQAKMVRSDFVQFPWRQTVLSPMCTDR